MTVPRGAALAAALGLALSSAPDSPALAQASCAVAEARLDQVQTEELAPALAKLPADASSDAYFAVYRGVIARVLQPTAACTDSAYLQLLDARATFLANMAGGAVHAPAGDQATRKAFEEESTAAVSELPRVTSEIARLRKAGVKDE